MCGINGIFSYHGAANAPERRELIATRDSMTRRGPDGSGEWWSDDRRLGFGHRRLSILDLTDQAAQPMVSADGRFIIVFNGEIYNTPELRAELAREGTLFRTSSDTEVLLVLYTRFGSNVVGRLRGMFAFSIWDTWERKLFLARDPYGIKPLYYVDDGWTFRFASQVKALLAGGCVSRDLDPAGIVGFHLWGHIPEPFTLYRGIRALPAGSTMVVNERGVAEPVRFYSVAKTFSATEPTRLDRAARKDCIREAVAASVRAHLLSDVDVGVFLSAGIDSGAILGLARDAGLTRATAVTVSFKEFAGSAEDEAPVAKKVAHFYDAEHVVRQVDEEEFRTDLPDILDAMDQPSIDGINTWFASKAASEVGLKVVLSGLGGDELFAGYPSFRDIPSLRRRYGFFARIPFVGRISRLLINALAPDLVRRKPKVASLLEYSGTLEGAYLLRRGVFLPSELENFLDRDTVTEGLERLRPLRRLTETLNPDPGSSTAQVSALESCHYMRDQLLRDADWAGMAHSVEIRTPLVDRVLLEALAPIVHALEEGEGKAALSVAPVGQLPESVSKRTKTGFGVPTGDWLTALVSAPPEKGMTKGGASREWAVHLISQQLSAEPLS